VLCIMLLFVLLRALIQQIPDQPRWLQIQKQRLSHFSSQLNRQSEARLLAAAIAQEKYDEKNDPLRLQRERILKLLCKVPAACHRGASRKRSYERQSEVEREPEAGYWILEEDTDDKHFVRIEDQSRTFKLGTALASLCACLVELV